MAFRTNKTPAIEERTVSGSSVSFNSAFALPIKACKVALTATQSGSGTPSPDNGWTINGYSAINIANASEDLYHDITVENGYLDTYGNVQASGASSVTDYIPVAEGLVYYYYDYATASLGPRNICIYDDNKQFVSYIAYETVNKKVYFSIPSNGAYVRITIDRNYTNQHLYNGTTTTIQIGSTVYGGTYDAITGVLTIKNFEFVGDTNLIVSKISVSDNLSTYLIKTSTNNFPNAVNNTIISSHFSRDILSGSGRMAQANNDIYLVIDNTLLSEDTATGFVNWLTTNLVTFVYELATPETIQLSPAQILTLKNNNIFADTGDIDLTYKDLDIAKRGSFREVFKLPS